MDIINNYYSNNQNQMLLQNFDDGTGEGDIIMEENEDTQDVYSVEDDEGE